MNGFGTLLIIGIVMYFLFSRGGGVGCCGGHGSRGDRRRRPQQPKDFPQGGQSGEIIDLKPEDYKAVE